MTLNIYDLDQQLVVSELGKNGVLSIVKDGEIVCLTNEGKAQQVVDRMYYKMPDLLPVQFHFMLAKSGLDDAIASLLDALKIEDINKYAMYKAYLTAARFYEFSKSYHLFTDVKDKIVSVNDALDFDLNTLKAMWLDATRI